MKFLIVGLLGENSHFLRVKQEAEKRGHSIYGCFASDLIVHAEKNKFEIHLKNNDPIESFDVVYLWTLGRRRYEWQVSVNYLLEKYGTKFINTEFAKMSSYLSSNSMLAQFLTQTSGELDYPRTTLFYNTKGLRSFISQYEFPVILKYSDGRKGKEVYKLNDRETLFEKVKIMQKTKKALLLREFIPNDGDIRIFTIGYKAIGAMKRTPKPGEFRSNIFQGGAGESFKLEDNRQITELAEKVSRSTAIEIAGVDIMIHKHTKKPYVLEVNPGPQFLGLEECGDLNIALQIVKYLEKKAKE